METEFDYEVFKSFARLHPVEAYDLNPVEFCRFMHEEDYNLTDEEIKNLINESRQVL